MSLRAPSSEIRPVALVACLVVALVALSGHATAAAAPGTITPYPIPVPSGARTVTPIAVTVAGDGRVWFVVGAGNGALVGRMTPTGTVGATDEITLPDAPGSQQLDLVGITAGPDSDVWATHDVGYVAHVPIAATKTTDVTDYTD